MHRVALIALLIASPAFADDDACFELGGQGIAPCATPKGKVAVESDLIYWQREGHGVDRGDTIAMGQSIARIGLGGLTEARINWTPLILDHPRGGPASSGIDDLTIGTKHQFGADGPLGLAVEVTLPTASNAVGQGTWSLQATVPVQIEVAKGVNFDLTGEVDAAADQDRHGRHFAASLVAGADVDLNDQLTMTTDVKLLRDNDPAGHTTQETASLALSHKLGRKGQFTVGCVAGLNYDAPAAEAYIGIGVLFLMPAQAKSDGLAIPRRYLAIGAMSAGSALVIIDGGVANVALPTIARDLGVAPSSVVSIVTIYQVTLVMLMLPFAGLSERIGLKRTYQGGQMVFTVATLLCFFAKSLPFLLVVRAAQAVGAACVLAVASALIRQIYPSDQLGRGLAINSVVVTSSAAAAPTIGGLILGIAPWPWVFAAAIPFAVVSLILGRAIPDPKPGSAKFDLAGAILCAAMFGLVIGGLESAVHGDSPVVSAAIVALGALVGWHFVRREVGKPAPILPVDLLAQPVLALSVVGGFLAFTASMTLLISTPFRLSALGFGAATIGAAIMPWPLTNMIVAPLAGYLSDRIPAGLLGGIGMAVSVTALTLIATMPAQPSYFDVAWRMALCGSGFGLYLPPNARLIVGSAPRHRAAAAGGLVSTVRLTGQTVGATVVAMLLAIGLGTGFVPPVVSACLATVAGLCSIARLRPSIRNPSRTEVQDEVPVLKQTR